MLIDVRCRLTVPEAGGYFPERLAKQGRWERIKAFAKGTLEAYFEEVAAAGVTTAVSVSGNNPGLVIGARDMKDRTTSNDYMAKVQKENWGRFIGVAGIDAGNVFHNALEEIDRCHKMGLRAIFIEPGRSPKCNLDDRRLYPIYQKCLDLNMTLIPQTSGALGGELVDYANPKYVERIAIDFPKLRIVCGHGCFPYIREAITLAGRRNTVFMSPDMYLLQFGAEDWVKAVNHDFMGFQDQFLMGSAYPSVAIKPYYDDVFKMPWKEEALPKICYRNALRAFDLENDPTFRKLYKL